MTQIKLYYKFMYKSENKALHPSSSSNSAWIMSQSVASGARSGRPSSASVLRTSKSWAEGMVGSTLGVNVYIRMYMHIEG